MRSATLKRAARVVFSLALLGAILFYAGPERVLAQLKSMDKGLASLAFVLLLAESVLRALNWFQLLRAGGREISLAPVASAYFVGGFFGALLPSTLGTDVARSAVLAARTPVAVEACLAATVLLNVLSLAVICAAALVAGGLLLGAAGAPLEMLAVSAAVAMACLSAIVAAWIYSVRTRHSATDAGSMPQLPGRRDFRQRAARFVAALRLAPGGLGMAGVTAVAACSYALRSLGWLALLVATGVPISWLALLSIGPLVTLGAALPVSVLGFGGFQAISVYLLGLWGVPPQHALAASLVQSGFAVLLHSIGCVVYAAGDKIPTRLAAGGDSAREEYSA